VVVVLDEDAILLLFLLLLELIGKEKPKQVSNQICRREQQIESLGRGVTSKKENPNFVTLFPRGRMPSALYPKAACLDRVLLPCFSDCLVVRWSLRRGALTKAYTRVELDQIPARSPNQTNATINPANPANGQANSQKKSQTPGKSLFFIFVFVCLDLAIFD